VRGDVNRSAGTRAACAALTIVRAAPTIARAASAVGQTAAAVGRAPGSDIVDLSPPSR
jgi:hypothetical protein